MAIETHTPIRPVILLHTYDRMNYKSIFSLNPGKSRSVFLQEVSVEGLNSHDVADLKARVFSIMEAALIKYGAKWIKVDS